MFRTYLLLGAAGIALATVSARAQESTESITVTAQKLAQARNGIQTQTGASTFTVTAKDIQAQPGGDNAALNSVVLQMPGVAQDSFGQLHIRGEHNGLQYRLNGIILPEGISVFGQTLDPRLAESVRLITGALPAEYGLRTAGIVDIQTKTGVFEDGGAISLYGGSHSTLSPSIAYGGSSGHFNYFVSGDYTTNTLGIESPDGSSNPQHDRTQQWHGFAYLQDILDANSSLSAVVGTSNAIFQIPNRVGVQPAGLDGIVGLGPQDSGSGDFVLNANGATGFPSENLDERQREITHYSILSYLHSAGSLDYQVSAFGRYSSLFFTPGNNVGDILFNGLAQTAYKRDVAYGLQAEGAWRAFTGHTIRFGVLYQADDTLSRTSSVVLATADQGLGNPNPNMGCNTAPDPVAGPLTCQTSATPLTIPDNGSKHGYSYSLYVQDEWKVAENLTVNYGLRYDAFAAYDKENQLSPRVNGVWTPTDTTTIHAGYARYFSPPPFELVASNDVALLDNTTSAGGGGTNDTPKAERADYFDLGMEQKFFDHWTVGLDSFYKMSKNLIDEGQFGAPIILTPFNYAKGRQYGGELTVNYTNGDFTGYVNASYERAVGKNINSSQFQFDPGDLTYITANYIPLDHQQLGSVSAGTSYNWDGTKLSADLLYGTGLRRDGATPNGNHVPDYVTVNVGISREFSVLGDKGVTARFDILNLLDEVYTIRDGTGVGVGAPQYGARRGFFFGLSQAL
ncbi:MAG TPA: TonB-dependent receptor [Rhizomicrobium sp.]|jgi:outer membrane receptor protein involved in Fe transport|nr:TonB-dependent receptor [Rhizomicrobium sp.]